MSVLYEFHNIIYSYPECAATCSRVEHCDSDSTTTSTFADCDIFFSQRFRHTTRRSGYATTTTTLYGMHGRSRARVLTAGCGTTRNRRRPPATGDRRGAGFGENHGRRRSVNECLSRVRSWATITVLTPGDAKSRGDTAENRRATPSRQGGEIQTTRPARAGGRNGTTAARACRRVGRETRHARAGVRASSSPPPPPPHFGPGRRDGRGSRAGGGRSTWRNTDDDDGGAAGTLAPRARPTGGGKFPTAAAGACERTAFCVALGPGGTRNLRRPCGTHASRTAVALSRRSSAGDDSESSRRGKGRVRRRRKKRPSVPN